MRLRIHKRTIATSIGKAEDNTKRNTTIHAWISEANEFTRKRIQETQNRDHEDHIAAKGYNAKGQYNLWHKLIPIPQAMKILEAKAAVDTE